MENNNSERFFSELAKAYAASEGAALINELADIATANRLPHNLKLERKIKGKKFNYSFRKYSLRALPLAACLIIAVLFLNRNDAFLTKPVAESTPQGPPAYLAESPLNKPLFTEISPEEKIQLFNSVELVSANLPPGYAVTNVDFDNAAAIIEIISEESNRIVLTVATYQDFDKAKFSKITVNGSFAYGLVKKDYCVLKYGKDEMLYTLTSLYDYGNLIEIIENI
jgi:hypothetical protein